MKLMESGYFKTEVRLTIPTPADILVHYVVSTASNCGVSHCADLSRHTGRDGDLFIPAGSDRGYIQFQMIDNTVVNPLTEMGWVQLSPPTPGAGYRLPQTTVLPESQYETKHWFSIYDNDQADRFAVNPAVQYYSAADSYTQGIQDFQFSPDSQLIAYRGTQNSGSNSELYLLPIAGGDVINLNPPVSEYQNVQTYRFSPDSSRVIYTAALASDQPTELYSIRTDGSGLSRLNLPTADRSTYVRDNFLITSDSASVLHTVKYEPVSGTPSQLFLAATDGSSTTPLTSIPKFHAGIATSTIRATGFTFITNDFHPGFSTNQYFKYVNYKGDSSAEMPFTQTFNLTPDGGTVVYLAADDDWAMNELYSIGLDGTGKQKLSGPFQNFSTGVDHFQVFSPTPGETPWVLYTANQESYVNVQLYARSIDPGSPLIKINGPLPASVGSVLSFQGCDQSPWVVYVADQDQPNVFELYSTNIQTGQNIKLSQPLVASGKVWYDFGLTPDCQNVVYKADAEVYGRIELYSARVDGSSRAKLSPAVSNAWQFVKRKVLISPDGHVIFGVYNPNPRVLSGQTTDWNAEGMTQVYISDINGQSLTTVAPPSADQGYGYSYLYWGILPVTVTVDSANTVGARDWNLSADGSTLLLSYKWLMKSTLGSGPTMTVAYQGPISNPSLTRMTPFFTKRNAMAPSTGYYTMGVGGVPSIQVSPSGGFTAIIGDLYNYNNFELYLAHFGTPIAPTNPEFPGRNLSRTWPSAP
jgi:hypothetical protein